MLASGVQQNDSVIHTYIYILFHYSLLQDIKYSSLCCTVGLHGLPVLYIATLLLYPIKMLYPSPSGRQIWDLWDPSLCLAATWINIFSAEKSWCLSIGLTVYRGKWSWFSYIRNTTDHFPMLSCRDHYTWSFSLC